MTGRSREEKRRWKGRKEEKRKWERMERERER